jgi:hypothetical protein
MFIIEKVLSIEAFDDGRYSILKTKFEDSLNRGSSAAFF